MIDYTPFRHVFKNNVPTNIHKCSVQMLITPFMKSLVHVRKRVLSWYLKSQAVNFASWNQSLVFVSWSKLLSANVLFSYFIFCSSMFYSFTFFINKAGIVTSTSQGFGETENETHRENMENDAWCLIHIR